MYYGQLENRELLNASLELKIETRFDQCFTDTLDYANKKQKLKAFPEVVH